MYKANKGVVVVNVVGTVGTVAPILSASIDAS